MTEPATSAAAGRKLFDTGAEDMARARKLFPNQGLHPAAQAWAGVHPRAIQYLEAAPVLVLAYPVPSTSDQRRQLSAMLRGQVYGLCCDGARLKDVMRRFSLSPPLRRLKPYALAPSQWAVIQRLSRMPPAELGNIIPETARLQRWWLGRLVEWREHLRARAAYGEDHLIVWAARELSRLAAVKADLLGEDAARATPHVTDVADFVLARDSGFSEAWGWNRAVEEMGRWHARLTLDRVLAGLPIAADTAVDLGEHPDLTVVDGFDFVALRTPRDLVEEGAAMRHCVASYLRDVLDGTCHIVGVRVGERRIATLEFAYRGLRQLKGPCNADVSAAVWKAAVAWVGDHCRGVGGEPGMFDPQGAVWRAHRPAARRGEA